jgi:glycogen(starch) synthase
VIDDANLNELDESEGSDTDLTADEAAVGRRRNHHRSGSRRGEPLLLEIAWEVCNQLGGIYTVLRSKAPSMVQRWSNRYVLVGPYNRATAQVEFEPAAPTGIVGQTIKQLQEAGVAAHYGRWLVTGKPHVVLLDYLSVFNRLGDHKYRLFRDHDIGTPPNDEWINNAVAFGEMCRQFLQALAYKEAGRRPIIAHFHEWMAGVSIPMLRREQWPGSIIFTTHATMLGRYLAMNDSQFYEHLPFYNPDVEAQKFNIQPQHRIERAAAHGSHVFTTVSELTGEECKHLLGRQPDAYLPNGLNIQRFAALHEFQNLHRQYKQRIHRFTMGHFFPSYNFDLDRTIYFYTSGRYEYRNKGMDITIEALARLNHRLRAAEMPVTVVAFIITRRPVRSINVQALQSNSMLQEFETGIETIQKQLGDRLFEHAAAGKIPDLNSLVDEYWMLRLRRTIHAWRRDQPPSIVTHDLIDDQKDDVLNHLRAARLWNQKHDPVKVIYHPDFITPANPLFGMEYDQFVRGCHLGIFPSYYEPWGYTPLESIALGVPAVTSDLSGFGSFLLRQHSEDQRGVMVLRRRQRSFDDSCNELVDWLFQYCQLSRRERIDIRNRAEQFSTHFDWSVLSEHYAEAHQIAIERLT